MQSKATGSKTSRFAGTLIDILDRVSYRPVRLSDVQDPVYRLRYEAYRREDFIPYNSDGVAGDRYDHTENAYCFGVYIGDELVSSIRFHHVTPEVRHSPSRTIYPEILDPILDAGDTYLDPSRFTADHEAALAYPALPYLTTRIIVMASDYFGVHYCLSSVRPEHGAFYKRTFSSEQVGEVRYYDGLQFPVTMYMADVPKVLPGIYGRFPFYRSTRAEQRLLFADKDAADYYTRRIPASARTAQPGQPVGNPRDAHQPA